MASASIKAATQSNEIFTPLAKGMKPEPVGTEKLELIISTLSSRLPQLTKPARNLILNYLANCEAYGPEHALSHAATQAAKLWRQGWYVFAHGQSLCHAALTESNQRRYAVGDTGSLLGERCMLLREPPGTSNVPATTDKLLLYPNIDDSQSPWNDALISVDYMFKNDTDEESALFYFLSGKTSDRVHPAFHLGGGRYYLIAVHASVVASIAYRCHAFGSPCMESQGAQAAALKPQFTEAVDTAKSYQARLIWPGLYAALCTNKARIFVYDTMSYAQRQRYVHDLDTHYPLPRAPLAPLALPEPRVTLEAPKPAAAQAAAPKKAATPAKKDDCVIS